MDEHKLTGWRLHFDDARRRFGRCAYRAKQINLSRVLVKLNSEEKVRDTILHEIAHALAGPGVGHGQKWKVAAMSVGCNPQRCYGDDVVTPTATFTGTCPGCGRTVERHRRSKIACGECCRKHNGGRYDKKFVFKWKRN
jgi:predicted SprT family Zn-dependent metalloprotease